METQPPSSFGRALVRPPGPSYIDCIRPPGAGGAVDYRLALEQHSAYVAAIAAQGLELFALKADPEYPDGCFVEDAAIVAGDVGIICAMGADSRRGETASVAAALEEHIDVVHVTPPATIDGGDVIRVGNRIFVGVTGRTNTAAIDQLRDILSPRGGKVIPVTARGVLHLKSACTYAGNETVVVSAEHVDPATFRGLRTIEVPSKESYAANCLAVGGVVLVSVGFPRTRELLEAAGFTTVEMEMSEFRKGWGSLTCLSVLF